MTSDIKPRNALKVTTLTYSPSFLSQLGPNAIARPFTWPPRSCDWSYGCIGVPWLLSSLLTCQGISWFLKSIFQILYTIDAVIHFDDNNWKISIKKKELFCSITDYRRIIITELTHGVIKLFLEMIFDTMYEVSRWNMSTLSQ